MVAPTPLQNQIRELESFAAQGGYLRVENVGGRKWIKRVDAPGFFKNLWNLFYKPPCERYDTVSVHMLELIKENPEIARLSPRLFPFLGKKSQNLKSFYEKKETTYPHLRERALEGQGDFKLHSEGGEVLFVHREVLNQVAIFRQVFPLENPDQEGITIPFSASSIEAFLDFVYLKRTTRSLTMDERIDLYLLFDYLCWGSGPLLQIFSQIPPAGDGSISPAKLDQLRQCSRDIKFYLLSSVSLTFSTKAQEQLSQLLIQRSQTRRDK